MNFIEKIITGLKNIGDFLGSLLQDLIDLIVIPLAFLLELLEGIFYFIAKLFEIVVHIITIFIALFQFLFAVVSGLFKTISNWIGLTPVDNYHIPSDAELGFSETLKVIGGTGLLTVVPSILIAILWIFFAIKIINLFGNKGDIK